MARKSSHGYRARRRLAASLDEVLATSGPTPAADADPGGDDDCSRALFDVLSAGPVTAVQVEQRIHHSPPPVAATLALALQRAQNRLLEEYRRRLKSMSTYLNESRCWSFLYRHLTESQRFGVEDEFRTLVVEGSGRFADSRMLRLGVKYYRHARGV